MYSKYSWKALVSKSVNPNACEGAVLKMIQVSQALMLRMCKQDFSNTAIK